MASAIRCSIVINTYSRAPYLEKLLSAFQHQTCDDFEVIVVNGPSTDWTEELLERYGGRIKVVDCPETNLSLSRNLGIAAAAGSAIVRIRDRQQLLEERLERGFYPRDRLSAACRIRSPRWPRCS